MLRQTRVALSCACALAAAGSCFAYTGHVRDEAERTRTEAMRRYGGEVVSLAVATRTIEAGEVVSMADVESRDWLASLAPEGAQTDVGSIVGKEVSVPICAGAPVTELNFRDLSSMGEIPSGHVAVSIPITEKLGISTGIAVGTHVVIYRATQDGAELIGGDATVLSVPSGTGSVASGSMTISVTAKDVPAVLTASAAGDLRVVCPASDVKEFASQGGAEGVSVEPAKSNESKDKNKGE